MSLLHLPPVYESLIDALSDMKTRGYTANFEIETDRLYCGDLDLRLNPQEFQVDEVHRFEGDSNPDDSAIVYAISSTTGVKGILIDAYGVYSENLSFDMAQKLQGRPTILN